MSDLCDRLKDERKRLGLNQLDFAALGGVKKNAQLNYESGERSPDSDYLRALYSAGVDIFYVLTGERMSSALTKDETQLIDGFRNLDLRGKAGVMALLGGLSPIEAKSKNAIQGDVGQMIDGDLVTDSLSFTVGGKKKS